MPKIIVNDVFALKVSYFFLKLFVISIIHATKTFYDLSNVVLAYKAFMLWGCIVINDDTCGNLNKFFVYVLKLLQRYYRLKTFKKCVEITKLKFRHY